MCCLQSQIHAFDDLLFQQKENAIQGRPGSFSEMIFQLISQFNWQPEHCESIALKPHFWPSCNSVCLEKWFGRAALGKHYRLGIRTKID